jgi:hypothetical protein
VELGGGFMKMVVIVIIASICMIVLFGCHSFRETSNDVSQLDLSKLLISEKDLPEAEWETNGINSTVIDTKRSPDLASITFLAGKEPDRFGMDQEVFRYTSELYAKNDYEYTSNYYRNDDPPSNWTFMSTAADESLISCRDFRNSSYPMCFWIARYGKIVINIRSWLNPEKMSLETMQSIVQKVDSLASEYVIKK